MTGFIIYINCFLNEKKLIGKIRKMCKKIPLNILWKQLKQSFYWPSVLECLCLSQWKSPGINIFFNEFNIFSIYSILYNFHRILLKFLEIYSNSKFILKIITCELFKHDFAMQKYFTVFMFFWKSIGITHYSSLIWLKKINCTVKQNSLESV